MLKGGLTYIVSSPNRDVLYTGVTSDLTTRVWKHKTKFYENSFTARYNCVVLVWYKYFDTIDAAIAEEKRIKAGSRKKKEELINSINYEWRDLWDEVKNMRLY
jgi:putative endonuclease